MEAADELMTTVEAAARMRASVPTLARWRCEGNGPTYIKRRGRILYRESDIDPFIDGLTRTKTRCD
jgi:hypothetical protein